MSTEFDKEEKAALRKKKRKKERMQAMALLGGAFVVALLILIGVISLVVKISSSKKPAPEPEQVVEAEEEEEALAMESEEPEVTEEPEEEEEVTEPEEETVSEDTTPEEEPDEEELVSLDDQEEDEAAQNEEIERMIDEEMSQMTIEQKISKLFILTPGQLIGSEVEGTSINNKMGDQLSRYPISGILFKPANIDNEDDLISAFSNLRSFSMDSLMYVVEDQGGESSPFITSGMSENVIASESEIGESLGTSGAYSAGISIGSEINHYGFHLNLAPYADVTKTPTSYAARKGFGKDTETTADLTQNLVRGMKDQGVICAVGCFPGYSDTPGDGSSGAVVSQRTKEQLEEEALPYQKAIKAGADAIMISHVGLPRVRKDQRPASLSKEVITDIVRDEWGFDGVIMTDYMDKNCIYQKYTYAEAAVGAIEAGADVLLSVKNFQKSYAGIMDAVRKGTLTEERIDESVRRILRLRYRALQ